MIWYSGAEARKKGPVVGGGYTGLRNEERGKRAFEQRLDPNHDWNETPGRGELGNPAERGGDGA